MAGELGNLARVKIGYREDEIEVIPMEIAVVDGPLQEKALIQVTADCGVIGLTEEWLEINDRLMAVIESNSQLVTGNVLNLLDIQNFGFWCAHLMRWVMTSVSTF